MLGRVLQEDHTVVLPVTVEGGVYFAPTAQDDGRGVAALTEHTITGSRAGRSAAIADQSAKLGSWYSKLERAGHTTGMRWRVFNKTGVCMRTGCAQNELNPDGDANYTHNSAKQPA